MKYVLVAVVGALLAPVAGGSAAAHPPRGPVDTSAWTTADDHRDMQEQLGIRALRPGRNADAPAPNAANYDEALAAPSTTLHILRSTSKFA